MRIAEQPGENAEVKHIAIKDKSHKPYEDGDYKPRCGQDGSSYTKQQTTEIKQHELLELHKQGELCEQCADLITLNDHN